jgi:hypothetical protein
MQIDDKENNGNFNNKTPTNGKNAEKEESKSPNISFKNKKDISNHKLKKMEDPNAVPLTPSGKMTPKSRNERSGLKQKCEVTVKKEVDTSTVKKRLVKQISIVEEKSDKLKMY